jgi:hypothetical protein
MAYPQVPCQVATADSGPLPDSSCFDLIPYLRLPIFHIHDGIWFLKLSVPIDVPANQEATAMVDSPKDPPMLTVG